MLANIADELAKLQAERDFYQRHFREAMDDAVALVAQASRLTIELREANDRADGAEIALLKVRSRINDAVRSVTEH